MDTTSLFTIRKLSEIKIRRSVFISPGASKYFPSTSLQKKKVKELVATTKGNSLSPIPCNNPVTAEPLWRPHIQQTKKKKFKKKKKISKSHQTSTNPAKEKFPESLESRHVFSLLLSHHA